jgi:hypothetical protein
MQSCGSPCPGSWPLAPRRFHLELFAATRVHHLFLSLDASVQLALPVSASPHQVGRRLAQGRFRKPRASPGRFRRPVPASRLGLRTMPRHGPAWMVGYAPGSRAAQRTPRPRLMAIWCGAARSGPTIPIPSRPPSRLALGLALHAGDRRRGRACDAHGESLPSSPVPPSADPRRRAR